MIIDRANYVGGRRLGDFSPRTGEGFTWVGYVDPTDEELAGLARDYDLPDIAVDDARHVRQRPKLDVRPGHAFVFVRTARYDLDTERVIMGDVAILLSSDFVVTVRHGDALPLRSIRHDLEKRPARLAGGPTVVLVETLDRLVDQYLQVGDRIAEDVRVIEDAVFDDDVPAAPHDRYAVKRELIDFQRAAKPFLEPLTRIATGGVVGVGDLLKVDFADVRDHLLRVLDQVEALERTMDAAMQANLSLLAVKQNEDMRKI